MSLADFVPEKFLELFSDPDFSKAIKGYSLFLLKEDPEYRVEVKTYFDVCLVTSELKPIKRIAELETITGLNDFTDFEDDEREPNIPEKIEALKEEIRNIEYKAPVSSTTTLEPTSKTDVRASLLVSEIRDSGKDHLTNHEIIHFLKSKLPDHCKVSESIQNIRKVKQDVLKAASNMYPDVFLSKKKTGHKEVRLILSS
jgi:hypothetical protein